MVIPISSWHRPNPERSYAFTSRAPDSFDGPSIRDTVTYSAVVNEPQVACRATDGGGPYLVAGAAVTMARRCQARKDYARAALRDALVLKVVKPRPDRVAVYGPDLLDPLIRCWAVLRAHGSIPSTRPVCLGPGLSCTISTPVGENFLLRHILQQGHRELHENGHNLHQPQIPFTTPLKWRFSNAATNPACR